MPDYLKLSGSLFFILFAFNYLVSAQVSEAEKRLADKEKTPPILEKKDQTPNIESENSFLKNYFQTKPSERKSLTLETGADDEITDWKLERGAKELNVEIGIAPTHPTNFNGKEFDTTGRKFALLSFRWGRVIGTPKNITYEYQSEVTPIALAFKNEVANPAFRSANATPNVAPTIRETTYGFAFSPVGFRFLFRPEKRLKPFVALHAGFIFFKKPVPLPQSLSYDFTGDFGGGVQYQIEQNKALNFGYRYYHISNMNIGTINPGYNANVFFVGYSFFYK